jgi:hypothetical protein
LGEILGSLGMNLDEPGTTETPRRFLQALPDPPGPSSVKRAHVGRYRLFPDDAQLVDSTEQWGRLRRK